jgi:hypothetical protein
MNCNCEDHLDNMHARWTCPIHGDRRPNYEAIFIKEEKEAEDAKLLTQGCRG